VRQLLPGLLLALPLIHAEDLPIHGIGHGAYFVSDLAKADAFYTGVLGFDRAFDNINDKGEIGGRFYKINDDQFIEIFPRLKPDQIDRYAHVCLQTKSIDKLHKMLVERGVKTPEVVNGRDGTRRFVIRDPEGNGIEFQQYEPGSLQAKSQGKNNSARRVSLRLRHVGVKVRDVETALKFYRDTLGFTETWRGGPKDGELRWINLRMPRPSGDYIELMVQGENPPTKAQLGSMHHMCFEVPDIQKAWAMLKQHGVPDIERHQPRIGRNNKWLLNLFDADGTRSELMEPNLVKDKR
jgi:lactoylglutathione lyase